MIPYYCRHIFFTGLFSYFSIVNGQPKVLFEQPVKGYLAGATIDYFVSENGKQYVFSLTTGDSITVFVFNTSVKLLHQFGFRKTGFERYLGGFIKNDSILISVGYESRVRCFINHISSDQVIEKESDLDNKKQKLLSVISMGDRYLHVSTRKNDPVIIITEFNTKGDFENKEYDVSDKALGTGFEKDRFWNELTRTNFLGREPDIATINAFELIDPENIANPYKLYYRNDSLILIGNKNEHQLKIFSIDLPGKNISFRQHDIDPPSLSANIYDPEVFYNSFLFRNNIYYLYGKGKAFDISVMDFYSGKEIISYEAGYNDTISFRNSEMFQSRIGLTGLKGSYKNIASAEEFTREMLKGQAAIYARTNKNKQTEIMISSFRQDRTYSYVPMGNYGSGGTSMGYMRVDRWENSMGFMMLVDPATNKHVAGEASSIDIFDRIKNYITGARAKDEAQAFLNFNNAVILFYINRTEKKFGAVYFKK